MKLTHFVPLAVLSAAWLALPESRAAEPTDQAAIDLGRSILKADRQATVAQNLQLTPEESKAFWPLYQRYRADMDKVGDALLKLVYEYAEHYPNVPEDRAKKMLKDLLDLEKQRVAIRGRHLAESGKVLPAEKNLRFAQVENRLDLALQLKLAASIPLVPVEGRLSGTSAQAAGFAEGVPGGAIVRTHQLSAEVIAINKASRKVTLLGSDGIKQTVKVGPDAINFDQIRVGDRLVLELTEELVVQLAGPGESPESGAAGVVALAPKGAKPGGLMAETTQVIATVAALDPQQHTATLRFDDGSTKTLSVRRDVDLSKRKVGEKVVISVSETLAIGVTKP